MVFNSPFLFFQSSIWQYRTSSAPTFNDILKKEKQKSSPGAKTKTETNQKPKPVIKEYSSQSYDTRKMPTSATVWRESQHAVSPTAHERLETHCSLHSPFLHGGPDRREPLHLLALGPQHESRHPPYRVLRHAFPRSKGRSTPRTAFPLLSSRWHPLPGSKGRSSATTQVVSHHESWLLVLLLVLSLLLLLP